MRDRRRKSTRCLMIALSTLLLMFSMQCAFLISAYAADPKVVIWNHVSGESIVHRSLYEGQSGEKNIGYKLVDVEAESYSWSSDNEAVFTVSGQEDTIYITGHSNGIAKLILTVKGKDGKTYTDQATISISKETEYTECITTGEAKLVRGAYDAPDQYVRKIVDKGTKMTIIGICGEYYRVLCENIEFSDGMDHKYAFVKKSSVRISVTDITLDRSEVTAGVGDSIKLNAVITPSMASNKTITWTSDDKKVASVDKSGTVKINKVGSATITAETEDGKHKAKCKIKVKSDMPMAAAKPKETKPELTGKATSFTSVKLTVKGGSTTVKKCGVIIDEKIVNLDKNKKYEIYIDNKRVKKNSFTLKKNKQYNITVKGLKKSEAYFFRVGKKGFKSNEVILTPGCVTLSARVVEDGIELKWDALSDSKGYYIYRGTSEREVEKSRNAYKFIKSKKTKKFVDRDIESSKTYYYAIRVKKSDEKSNVEKCLFINVARNIELAKNDPLFSKVAINRDENWNANQYYVGDNIYPPVKYRFTGDVLEIHLYIDFVQYNPKTDTSDGIYFTKENDPYVVQNGESCRDTFLEGLKKGYDDIYMDSSEGDFDNSIKGFTTKLITHLARTESYNPNQKFVEVRLGGVAPLWINSSDYYHLSYGNYWFHANTYNLEMYDGHNLPYIYMPTNAQLATNISQLMTVPKNKSQYMDTAAHEMGHILGLMDAYTDWGIDRCADNAETCEKLTTSEGYRYLNLMKSDGLDYVKIRLNDIEMMLLAYNLADDGITFNELQSYKDFNDVFGDPYKISDAIINREDELYEGTK
ncbi:MAG: Ig-like domain-containing protein [Mogibacterium sp.]|nr:Ig-like domain-containing protein [Mogibacterium sp.]